MIRKATPDDIPEIVELAVTSVSQNPLPVIIDREAMREQALSCLSPANFLWVSEVDGKVVGAVAAAVHQSFWHERNVCSVLLYYSAFPGEGVKLIREFVRWVKSRPAIKIAVMELEPESDPRLTLFMKRLGFNRESTNISFVRGM